MARNASVEFVEDAFLRLTESHVRRGATIADLESAAVTDAANVKGRGSAAQRAYPKRRILLALLVPLLCAALKQHLDTDVVESFRGTRCLLPNNYLVWEFTRPISDCDYCRGVEAPLILPNLTREQFRAYSYSSRPMIIKRAAHGWPAREKFTLEFFKDLYERTDGAYESVAEECQFLGFKGNFADLREAFAMSERRALHRDGEEPWYIGWKNCHPRILDAMRPFYGAPHFLPDDAEIPYSNYIFLGYEEGAVMHLDYISRLMWQAQIVGSKTWTVAPTPECHSECESFQFSVGATDIVLLDTRIWYHGTRVENGNLSLTVTSEYG